jgi:hypothetical protein
MEGPTDTQVPQSFFHFIKESLSKKRILYTSYINIISKTLRVVLSINVYFVQQLY